MSLFNLPKVDLGEDCEGGVWARPSSSSSSINNASDESTPLISKTNDEEKANIGISSTSNSPQEEQTKKPLFISILTLLISIPALVGKFLILIIIIKSIK